jgi:hypothetical protein
MKNIIHISDFFSNEIRGGAELVDEIVISSLVARGHNVTRVKSKHVTEKLIKDNAEKLFIVSNFVMLPAMCINLLQTCDYVIYEHDHKYIVERDPSRYKDYKVPENRLVNLDFYQNAKAVFAQSKLHAEVISKNIKGVNVISLGCSLWSDKELDILQKHIDTKKNGKMAVLDDLNQAKGAYQAKSFCESNNIKYNLIPRLEYDEFIAELAKHEGLAFFSQVLETFCRVVVEARILNCSLKTNNNLGCVSEEWFPKYKGQELLDFVRSQKTRVIDKVEEVLQSEPNSNSKEASITVILNAYRRPYNLKMQIDAIRKQTTKPTQIWLWVNQHEDNDGFDFKELDLDRIFHNDFNWKFYGRFAAALLADTEYVAIFDDDTIPGERWFDNCLETMQTDEGILGSAGVTLNDKYYVQHDRCGWPTQNSETTRVDLVGHAWFFKRNWLQYLWREKPTTWDNGEDIQFSYLAQKYGNIQTYCPPHPPEDKSMHGSILGNELGIDVKATSTNQAISHQRFFNERDVCVQTAIKGGWNTVKEIKV